MLGIKKVIIPIKIFCFLDKSFIFTYFCGAVYDDNVLGKVNMSTASVYNIYEMFVAKWIEQGKMLSMKDIERVVYRYSRELEHSDINLERMEEITF